MNKLSALTFFLLTTLCVSCSEQESKDLPQEVMIENSLDIQREGFSLDPETSRIIRDLFATHLTQIDSELGMVAGSLALLNDQVIELIRQPNDSTLLNAKSAWSDAHVAFEQTTLHRYLGYAIAPQEESLELFTLQYQMNQWPILAGYIDSVNGYESGGIVHDVNVDLSPASLRQQHGLFDMTEATLGFHVIEFILWGETGTPSVRTAGDFVALDQLTQIQRDSGMEISQLGNNRRRQFLSLTTRLLIEDFAESVALWEKIKSNIFSSIEDRSSASLLNVMLASSTSMLTEELLIKSLYPLLNGELEDAVQSPYSQTSEKAVAALLRSIESLVLETPNAEGLTLDKVLVTLSPSFEDFFYQNLDASKACMVLLYSKIGASDFTNIGPSTEFEIVECINLLTNLIDQLEQINLQLPPFQVSI